MEPNEITISRGKDAGGRPGFIVAQGKQTSWFAHLEDALVDVSLELHEAGISISRDLALPEVIDETKSHDPVRVGDEPGFQKFIDGLNPELCGQTKQTEAEFKCFMQGVGEGLRMAAKFLRSQRINDVCDPFTVALAIDRKAERIEKQAARQ